MKDKLDNKVVTGDVMLEIGRGFDSASPRNYFMNLWEVPENYDNCHGFQYNIDGKKYLFAWANLKDSYKVDISLFPKSFKFSFYHGMDHIQTTLEDGEVLDLINKSDWKEKIILVSKVEQFAVREKIIINSIEDIKNNIKELVKEGYVPHELMTSVLKVAKVNKTNPDFGNFKGEIGLAYYNDMLHYHAIINMVELNTKSKR